MTLETLVVVGLVVSLSLVAALLWRSGRRRDSATKLSKRAQRLREQLEWDRMAEGHAKKP